MITIPVKPLSVNQAWQGRRFKTPAYKRFEQDVMRCLTGLPVPPKGDLRLFIEFGFSNKASDLSNPLKLIEDILSKRYGFNDNRIYHIELKKTIAQKGREFIRFEITPMGDM